MLGSKSHHTVAHIGRTLNLTNEELANIKTQQNNEEIIKGLVDSGSTITCVRHKKYFKTYKPLHSTLRNQVQDASGQIHCAIAIGDITAIVNTTKGRRIITIRDVLHVPSFSLDIISTNLFRKQGYKVTLPPYERGYTSIADIKITHELFSDGLEYIRMQIPNRAQLKSIAKVNNAVNTTYKAPSIKTWINNATKQELLDRLAQPEIDDSQISQHMIQAQLADLAVYAPKHKGAKTNIYMRPHTLLGHANSKIVRQYAKRNLNKLQYKQLGNNFDRFCKSCARHKSKKISLPKLAKSPTTPTRPWQYQATDIIGRYATKSIVGQYHYCMLFVDKYSYSKRVYGLKQLSDIPQVLEAHLKWCKSGYPDTHTRCDITHVPTEWTAIKSDATALLRTPQVQAIYSRYGIQHHSSPPYTQARNSLCERAWGSIKNSAQCMRQAKDLPLSYWYHSIRHATTISNILPTAANDGKSPYEMVTGRRPDISLFHTFGSTAYIHRPKPKMGGAKAVAGMWLGLIPESNSHMILLPPTKGGDQSLHFLQPLQKGETQPRSRTQIIESIHVQVDDRSLPDNILSGKVPLIAEGWGGTHPDDMEDELIIGNTTVPIPDIDRTDEDTLDLDYHQSHCITTPGQCKCIDHNPNVTQPTLYIPKQKEEQEDETSYDKISHLVSYPRVLAIGGIKPSLSAARKDTNPEHVRLYEEARQTEMDNLIDKGIIHKTNIKDVPRGEKILPPLMNFVLKGDAENNITRARARWVLGGHRQIEGLHYHETAAFCPRWSTIRTLIAAAAKCGRKLRTGDISSAYLWADAQTELYMHSPHDQKETDEDGNPYVWRVSGNLYGRKEAGCQWGKYLTKFLKSIGFNNTPSDPCYFSRNIQVDGVTHITHLIVYVDDLAYYSNIDAADTKFEKDITDKFGDIKAGIPDLFLGANIKQTKDDIHLSHSAMIDRMAEKFFPHLEKDKVDLTKNTTPFPSHGSALGAEVLITDCPDLEKGDKPINAPYRELVGALSYCAVTTRPDIAFYTSQLARVQSNPGNKHFQLAKHVLRYLMSTRTHGITYHKGGDELKFYVDSSWADIKPTYVRGGDGKDRISPDIPTSLDDGRRSSYGYVGYYASGPISWASRIHKGRRTLSSTEAELVAATEACKDITHIRQVLNAMKLTQTKPTVLYEDNQSTINIILKEGITARSKHIEVKWYYVRDMQLEEVIEITKLHTSNMTADIYTKRLAEELFTKFRNQLVQAPRELLTIIP